jgi:hypothetical protein
MGWEKMLIDPKMSGRWIPLSHGKALAHPEHISSEHLSLH